MTDGVNSCLRGNDVVGLRGDDVAGICGSGVAGVVAGGGDIGVELNLPARTFHKQTQHKINGRMKYSD